MKGTAIASIAVMAAALACGRADAADSTNAATPDVCPPPGAAWLRASFAGEGFGADLRTRVVRQLGADLSAHQIVLCEAGGPPTGAPPLADIAVTFSAQWVLSLEVHDAVTDKRMTRDLPLRGVPADALALSITLAAEELLRASWIEAAFAPRTAAALPAIVTTVPPAVQALNADEIARMPQVEAGLPHRFGTELAILGVLDRTTGGAARGQTDLGADLRFAWGARFTVGARVGLREAIDVASSHGSVQGRMVLGGIGVGYAFVPRAAVWGGELGARVDALDVVFAGVAAPGARATHGSALGAIASGTLGGWRRLGRGWRIVAEMAVGAPIRPVTASDNGAFATGVSGVSIGAAVGLAATLPE